MTHNFLTLDGSQQSAIVSPPENPTTTTTTTTSSAPPATISTAPNPKGKQKFNDLYKLGKEVSSFG